MNWPEWTSPDGRIRLINADCLEVLPSLAGIDAVVTDPPYGIGWDVGINPYGNLRAQFGMAYQPIEGDDKPFDPSPWLPFPCVLFGANHYANRLPNSGAWIVWDKRMHVASTDQSDCELAWSNIGNRAQMIRFLYHGGGSIAKENHKAAGQGVPVSLHPTQKPVEVMKQCVTFATDVDELILDPYAGVASTAIACHRTNRRCIAIEKERKYFDIGVSRVKAEYARTALIEEACA